MSPRTEQEAAMDDMADYAQTMDRDTDNTCPTCTGTGEGSSEHVRCWRCKGRGWLLASRDDDDEPDYPRHFDRSERCYD